jgi:hypothetical protein
MMNKLSAALVILALLLAACGSQSSEALPTLIPTPGGVVATKTPVQPTEPPTPEPLTRPTLPPTWTPESGVSGSDQSGNTSNLATPTPESLNTLPPAATEVPTLVVCGTFVADRNRSTSTFVTGTTPQIFWSKVETAFRYRIRLLDSTGKEVFVDFSLEPTYTFRTDLFEKGKVYGWSVYPEDSLGQQMCTERGAELLPQ